MAKYGSANCVLLIDGYDVLGVTTQLDHTVEAVTEETTALGDSWPVHEYANMKKASLTQDGFYDAAAGSSNAALNEKQGTARVVVFGFEGNTVGKRFSGYSGAMQADYKRIAARGELHKASASYQGSGIVEDGLIIHEHATEGAAGNTTDEQVDGGAGNAPSSAGASGYLQVSALTLGGYTNVVVKLRDSPDDITYSDLITFTAVTAAPAAQRATVTGDVDRYVAAAWAYTGAGTGQSVKFLVGLVRN